MTARIASPSAAAAERPRSWASGRLLTLPLALALVALMGLGCAPALAPRATGGVLDLSMWDLDRDGPVSLDGDWEFYWHQLLTPDDFVGQQSAPVHRSGLLAVPGAWTGWRLGDQPLPADGYATYRLRITGSDYDGVMAIHIPYMLSAYRLWVDGTLVATNGVVGTTEATTTAQYVPVIAYFAPRSDVVQIVVQVANFNFRNGGIWSQLALGTAGQIVDRQARAMVLGMALFGGILIMALYHLVVYLFRRGDRSACYFGLFCLVIAVRVPFTSNPVLLRLLPALSADLQLKLEYLTDHVGLPLFLLFLASVYPQEVSAVAVRLSQAAAGVLGVASLLAPSRLSSVLILPYEALVTLFVAYSVFALVRATARGREGARVFLIGGGVFLATLVHDLLHYNQLILSTDLMPLGLFVLILAQSGVLAQRFAHAFRRQVVLGAENARLLADLRQHLDEQRQWRRLLAEREEQLKKDIAELLHSRVQTRLLVVWHWLGEVSRLWARSPREAQALLERARDELDRLRETDIRQASHLLHPAIIGLGLAPAVRSLLASHEGQFHIRLEVDPRLAALESEPESRLPELVRLTAYRVLEEGLNNVHAHAAASRVHVFLGLADDGQLHLRVEDDGRGLPQPLRPPGLGLRSIAARVGERGGRWELAGAPGEGTTLSVWLPLEEAPAAPGALPAREVPSAESGALGSG